MNSISIMNYEQYVKYDIFDYSGDVYENNNFDNAFEEIFES